MNKRKSLKSLTHVGMLMLMVKTVLFSLKLIETEMKFFKSKEILYSKDYFKIKFYYITTY